MALGCLLPFLAACHARAAGVVVSGDAGEVESVDWLLARALVEGRELLPERSEALGLARRMEARADRAESEKGYGRAVVLRTAAARIVEKVWRSEGHEQDAREAIELYRAASRRVHVDGACEAAFEGAHLLGDVSRDPVTKYTELYRAQRRFGDADGGGGEGGGGEGGSGGGASLSFCQHDIDEALSHMQAFRPPRPVLEAIEAAADEEGRAARGPAESDSPELVRVESWPGRDAARVVLVFDRPVAYRVGDSGPDAAPSKPAIFVDLPGIQLGASLPRELPSQGIVRGVRTQSLALGARVSIDVDVPGWRHVFELRQPYRVVIDVARRAPGAREDRPRTVSRIVLDPGHGGSDHGAKGPTGLEEKDIALDIARRVAPALAEQGVEVSFTRTDDSFVSLEERTAKANSLEADLFLSIHCNASESRGPRGVETYVLDTGRDEIAARVAARENQTTQTSNAELGQILSGLRMADGSRWSRRLAELLLRTSTSALQSQYRDAINGGVHGSGFYVLVGARMPAVLLETSYISNPVEEQRLAHTEYRQLLADAIANAVRAYREGR